ncbi:hypothetical protein [Okeania sp. SIO3I5]|uniref:hypothetical protein n=1 Tax=Okeania sp. SIO3I5 TaxID=2607805 RepID=UPI0025DD43FB|nr:hypothetical protein [Okeania sp. SIO3I5]
MMLLALSRNKTIINNLDGSISVGFDRIQLPRIGWVKTYEILPDNVTPKSVTITEEQVVGLSALK